MLEPAEDQYIVIGEVIRSHGIKGEVVVQPAFVNRGLFDDLHLVHYENARRELVPARLERVRIQEKGNRLSFFVKFEHVSDRNQAEEIRGSALFVHRDKIAHVERSGQPDFTRFLGWTVRDEKGSSLGNVTGILENPAHLILEVTPDDGEQRLIPLVDEYVESVEEEGRTIQCRRLDQLEGL